jgi:hypothetical protein
MSVIQGSVVGAPEGVLREMRRARRRRYVEQVDVMEVLYRVYVGAIFGAIALAILGGAIHSAPATPDAIEWLRRHGPALIGIAVAVGVLAGLRTGSHGGPLAIEAAEVQYVLLAPLGRGRALRPLALRQIRTGALIGAIVGAVVGNFVFRRLPGSPVEWIGCLALFGALVPATVLGCALLASGRRLPQLAAGAIGVALLAWSGADVALGSTTSPATMLGELATLPVQHGVDVGLAGVGAVLALALLAVGLAGVGGILLEAARNRAALAAELRFSASVADLRTVILLRRQLASERPRRRPWLRLGRGVLASRPVWRRGWQSFLRWPPARIVRVVLIGAAAGGLAAAAWRAAPIALFVPGLLLFVAALDLVEPLAQESDHPTRRQLLPARPGQVIGSHLAAPASGLAVVVLIATAVAALAGGGLTALAVGLLDCAPIALALACCAAFSATNDPYEYILAPQIGNAMAFAPVAAASVLVGLPLIVASQATRDGSSPVPATVGGALMVAVLVAAAVPLLRERFVKRDKMPA